MKSNRITAEEQDKDKLGKFVLRERPVDKNGWQHIYQAGECALYTWCLCLSNWGRESSLMILPPRHRRSSGS